MKTAELEREYLDYYVAKAEGLPFVKRNGTWLLNTFDAMHLSSAPNYSENWKISGPIIDREKISLSAPVHPHPNHWVATPLALLYERAGINCSYTGRTPLIAAMRAFVASRFGDEVEDIPSC